MSQGKLGLVLDLQDKTAYSKILKANLPMPGILPSADSGVLEKRNSSGAPTSPYSGRRQKRQLRMYSAPLKSRMLTKGRVTEPT